MAKFRSTPLLIIGLVGLMAFMSAINLGAVSIQVDDWIHPFGTSQNPVGGAYVLWQLRIPRALLAILIGMSLGFAGALAQSLFRNPLADPGLLGVLAGASMTVAIGIVIFNHFDFLQDPNLKIWSIPFFAFIGAITVCLCLDHVARYLAPGSISGLLLVGIALNAVTGAVIGLCTYLATDEQLRNFTFWTLGSLANAQWFMVIFLFITLVITWSYLKKITHDLNSLALGVQIACHIGIDVDRLRTKVIVTVAILSGLAVSWCGMIGFIGLIAPNLVRIYLGSDQRVVLPYSAMVGGILLLIADTIARTIVIPAEVPVGIFTSLLGGPLFLILLRQYRSRID